MTIWKSISVAALASAVALPVPQAAAGIGDGIVGGLVGGVVSGIIVNEGAKARERERPATVTRKVYVTPYNQNAETPSRASNREVQTSLNYFGFSAGYPDGILGQQSRSAISQYQAYMGYPVTGRLTAFERDFLVTSHQRAQVGGSATASLIAGFPDGSRGLLHHYRDQLAGGGAAAPARAESAYGLPPEVAAAVDEIANSSDPSAEQLLQRSGFLQLADLNNDGRTDYLIDTSVTGSSFWCGARDCAVSVFASTPSGYQRNDFLAHDAQAAMFTCERGDCRFTEDAATGGATMVSAPAAQPQAAQPAAPALPRFAVPGANPSLAAFCNRINVLTSSSGGLSTLASLDNPDRAVSEQFCLARSYAIGTSDDLAAQVRGASREEIESQCLGLVPALEAQTAALSLEPRAAVLRQVSGFIAEAGMSPAEVTTSGRLCLGVGYAIDDMSLALASALLLSGQGDAAYDELMGHHLWHGFGAGKRPEMAEAWYDAAIRALDAGGEPAFAPTQGDRAELLRAAVFGGQQQGSGARPGLPTFKVGD